MPGGCSEGQQRLCGQRPVLVEYFALGHDKISPRAQHPRIRLDAPARHRLQVVDAQLHGSDLRSLWYRRISRNRRRGICKRCQNSSVHHPMNLLVVGLHVQPKNGPSLVHAFHVESQKLHRAAFFHPLPHKLRDPLLFFRHFLGHPFRRFPPSPLRPSSLASPPLTSLHFFSFLTENLILKTENLEFSTRSAHHLAESQH